MPVSPKRSKREKINNEFAERVIEAVDADATTTLFWVSCETQFRDPRPYQWAGFDVEPQYTYRLDLDSNSREELMGSFSKSLRREIREGADAAVTVRSGGRDDVRRVFEITKARYEEQGEPFDLSLGFVLDLFDSLADRARVYVTESESGEFVSGMIVLYSADTAYFWKGGTRRSDHDASANSLLHWNAIEDVLEDPSFETVATYDFSTANNRGIVRYKRKFGGHLTPYYRIESAGAPMTVAKRAYRLKRGLLS